MKPWSNRLNTEGYVTFAVDYHLFSEGVGSPVFPLPEQNIKAAVQYLRGTANALGIRNDHIVVEGFSSGARLGRRDVHHGRRSLLRGQRDVSRDLATR